MSELYYHEPPKKPDFLNFIALGCAAVSLVVAIGGALSVNSLKKTMAAETDRLDQMDAAVLQLQQQVEDLQAQLQKTQPAPQVQPGSENQPASEADTAPVLGLSDYKVLADLQENEGYWVQLIATPVEYQQGMTAYFIVETDGEVFDDRIPGVWDYTEGCFTAVKELPKADSYRFSCELSTAAGNSVTVDMECPELENSAVTTGDVNCELLPEAAKLNGKTLTFSDVLMRVTLPLDREDAPFSTELTLVYNGKIADTAEYDDLDFEATEAVGTYELVDTLRFRLDNPLKDGDTLELLMAVIAGNDADPIFCTVTWEFSNGELQMTAG